MLLQGGGTSTKPSRRGVDTRSLVLGTSMPTRAG